jgi:ubiquinone/menaquinone biosynthesis C-methylase UbiE
MDGTQRVREEFTRQAETLAASPAFTDADVLAKIHAAVNPQENMEILDLGCGPGIVASDLAGNAGRITAFDLTPEMLAKAKQRCKQAGISNVTFELGRAEELPFAKNRFDAVLTRLTIHHFQDPRPVMSEMARVIRPGGRLVIADIVCSENPEEASLHNALEVLRDPSHIRMLPGSRLLALIAETGMRVTGEETWAAKREFTEWVRITNAPERAAPLAVIMSSLAKAGIQAGVNLRLDGTRILFTHRWLLVTAEK